MTPGHHNYWFNHSHPFGGIFDYDPADDGPECEIISCILASHPHLGFSKVGVYRNFLRDIFGT